MSQFDDELRAAASRLAPESLPDNVLDESLDAPVDERRWPAVLVTIAGALILALVAFGAGRWLPTVGIGPAPSADLPVVQNDPRFAACGGNAFPVMAAFPLERASDFAQRFPNAGKAPELDESSDPAFVVVFQGQWEGPVLGRIGSYPPRKLDPEHHDLCVWVGDVETGYQTIYANVDTAGMNAGDDGPSSSPTAPEATPVTSRPDLVYTCGGPAFSPDLIEGPTVDLSSTEAGAALADFRGKNDRIARILPADGWHLISLDETRASFVATTTGDPAYVSVDLELREGSWKVVGWGGCRPAVLIDGAGPATWQLVSGEDISATTTSFLADVTEVWCAGAASSEDRIRSPVILYEPDRVVVIFTVEPLDGAQLCPANPPTTVSVDLAEPLGDRQLLDGGMLPWRDPRDPDGVGIAPAQPFEPTPFRGDFATLLSEVEEHMGAQVRVTGDIGTVAEGGPILTLTSTGTGMGEILVVFDTRLNGGEYSLDYVRGEPATVEGTLLELTAENIDSIGDRYIDGATVIDFMRGPKYLIISTSVFQR